MVGGEDAMWWFALAFAGDVALDYEAKVTGRVNAAWFDASIYLPVRFTFGKVGWIALGPGGNLRPWGGSASARLSGSIYGIANLYAGYSAEGTWGAFSQATTWTEPPSSLGDELARIVPKPKGGEKGLAHHATLGASVRAPLGPILLMDTFVAHYWWWGSYDGDWLYDPATDLVVENRGWAFDNQVFVGANVEGIRGGATWTWRLGDRERGAYHSVGLRVAATFNGGESKAFQQPTVSLESSWWLQHPERAGQEISKWMPQIGLTFAFRGTIIGGD